MNFAIWHGNILIRKATPFKLLFMVIDHPFSLHLQPLILPLKLLE